MGKKATLLLLHYLTGIFTVILAIVTIMSQNCEHYSIRDYPIIAFLHLAIIPLLIMNAIIFVWWLIRFKFWLWFPLITLIYSTSFILTIYRPAFLYKEITSVPGKTIKVATFNIAGFDNGVTRWSVSALANNFKKDNPDIICMQEFVFTKEFELDSISRIFKDYPYYAVADRKHPILLAIYSKYPIISSKFYRFKDEAINGIILSTINVKGKKIDILTTHLQTTNFNQNRSMIKESLSKGLYSKLYAFNSFRNALYHNFLDRTIQSKALALIKKHDVHYPLIICGDLNSTPFSYVYSQVKGNLNDAFVDNGQGKGSTYKYLRRLFRIDHIFYDSTYFKVKSCEVKHDYDFSDHYPQIATFVIK